MLLSPQRGEIWPPSHMHNPGLMHRPLPPHAPWLHMGARHNPDLPLWLQPEQHADLPLDLHTFGPRSWSNRWNDEDAEEVLISWILSDISPVSSGP